MVSDFHTLVAFLSFLGWPVLIAVAQFGLTIPDQAIESNVRERGRLMARVGWILLALAALLAGLSISVAVTFETMAWHLQKGNQSSAFFGVTLAAADALMSGIIGIVLVWQSRRLRRLEQDCMTQIGRVADSCGSVRVVMWVLQAVILLLFSAFFPPLFLLASLMVAAWLPISLLAGSSRKSSQLLLVLSLAIKHGRPIGPELQAFTECCRGSLRSRLRMLGNHLDDGCSLGEALQFVPSLMPRWMVAEIRAAEASGTLAETLPYLVKQHTNLLVHDHTRASYAGWLSYGLAYGGVAALIVSFLMIWIVPKFKAIFRDFGTELPGTSIAMVQVADVMSEYWFLAAPLLPLGMWTIIELMRAELTGGKSLRWPWLHRIYLGLDAPDVLRHLSATVKHGRLMPDALTALSRFHFRASIARALADVAVATQHGADVFEELCAQRFLSTNDLAFLTTARQAGNLEWALSELADLRERRLAYRQRVLCEFLRPVPIVIGGLITLFIALAFFMPIVKLVNDLS